ncbi:M23 family metallopeptidase [Microbacterium album]|uniref:M23ase beta-sheet core domain-containing protein n=1 Tax=Microbacterium album TaxID=2053191 RepID=A0A917IH29_9MICO|nr:M23 family metallopeptidase [Microbacterium album]GGH46207.1 hypothetical protein GCM10010921_22110 [Microbacterium album]
MPAGIDLEYPFAGRWLVQNSPADRVPSHGTGRFATSHAIDFVPTDAAGRTAPIRLASLVRPESPSLFPGFGRAILAPVAGTVVRTHDAEPDHDAFRGLPSIGYALTQVRRAAAGWPALAGNHVMIERDGVVVVLCHLAKASVTVRPGERVDVGEPVGRCGNSGNSTEPHLHIQAMTGIDAARATPVPLTFRGSLPRSGTIVVAD